MNCRRACIGIASVWGMWIVPAASVEFPPIPNRSDTEGAMNPCVRDSASGTTLRCLVGNLRFLRTWNERDRGDMDWQQGASELALSVAADAELIMSDGKDRPYLAAVGVATYGVPKETSVSTAARSGLCGVAHAALEQACHLQVCGHVIDRPRVQSFVQVYREHCDVPPATCTQPINERCKVAYDRFGGAARTYASRVEQLNQMQGPARLMGEPVLNSFKIALRNYKSEIATNTPTDEATLATLNKAFLRTVAPAELEAIRVVDGAVVAELKGALPVADAKAYDAVLDEYTRVLHRTTDPSTLEQYATVKQQLSTYEAATGALFSEMKNDANPN